MTPTANSRNPLGSVRTRSPAFLRGCQACWISVMLTRLARKYRPRGWQGHFVARQGVIFTLCRGETNVKITTQPGGERDCKPPVGISGLVYCSIPCRDSSYHALSVLPISSDPFAQDTYRVGVSPLSLLHLSADVQLLCSCQTPASLVESLCKGRCFVGQPDRRSQLSPRAVAKRKSRLLYTDSIVYDTNRQVKV